MAAKNNEQGTNNLRDCITKIRYLEINREEQHLGALLFSFLIDQENRNSFILCQFRHKETRNYSTSFLTAKWYQV